MIKKRFIQGESSPTHKCFRYDHWIRCIEDHYPLFNVALVKMLLTTMTVTYHWVSVVYLHVCVFLYIICIHNKYKKNVFLLKTAEIQEPSNFGAGQGVSRRDGPVQGHTWGRPSLLVPSLPPAHGAPPGHSQTRPPCLQQPLNTSRLP